jgi:hypothetical protein
MSGHPGSNRARVAASILVGLAYYFFVTLTGDTLHRGADRPGYYTLLGRAFAAGRLDLPLAPAPELLALPDPWDPAQNEPYRMHDLALFGGRYYLYHGAAPALLLFAPFNLATGRDLPERLAALALCFGGFLFAAATLLRLLALAAANPPPWLQLLMLTALGLCTGAPFLLNRVWVYEISIAGGWFFTAAATYLVLRAVQAPPGAGWMAAAGAMFGAAVACRPHHVLAAGAALVCVAAWTLRRPQPAGTGARLKPLGAFIAPLAVAGLAIAAYNAARFGNPLEFGVRYLLAGDEQQRRVELAAEKILPGLRAMVARAPELDLVFPWLRAAPLAATEHAALASTSGHYLEPVVGAVFLAPFLFLAVLAAPTLRRMPAAVTAVTCACLLGAAAELLFVAATGFTTQRYLVDFLPAAALAALTVLAVAHDRGSRGVGAAIAIAFTAAATVGLAISLALAIHGPGDDFLRDRPNEFTRLARLVTPVARLRPAVNPPAELCLAASFSRQPPGTREPLLAIGSSTLGLTLEVEHRGDSLVLISQADRGTREAALELPSSFPVPLRVTLLPEAGMSTVTIAFGGRTVLTQTATVVSAPAQLLIGESRDRREAGRARFSGALSVVGCGGGG